MRRQRLRCVPIIARLINSCWFVFQWGLVLAVAAALGVGGYFYFRLDEEIRRHLEHRLASHYRQLVVVVGGARFEKGRGIAIYDLSLAERGLSNTKTPLLKVDELFLSGPMQMEELVQGQPHVERIVIRRAKLRAVRQPDGKWNVATLIPLPKFSEQAPPLSIEDATLVLDDVGRTEGGPLTIRGLNVVLTPQPSSPEKGSVVYHVAGIVDGLPARELRFDGSIGTRDGSLDLTVKVVDLEVSPELLASAPGVSAKELREASVSGRADIDARISRAAGPHSALNWSAALRLDRGQFDHPMLPHAITNLNVALRAEPSRLVVEKLTGKCGTADVALACERCGWGREAPLGMAVRIVGLPLDHEFESRLPPMLSGCWRRFQPSGIIDAEVRLTFDGRRWMPEVTAHCRGVSLTDADKFPYPLESATGTVTYSATSENGADRLVLDLTAVGAGRPVQIKADFTQLNCGIGGTPLTQRAARVPASAGVVPHPAGWIEISGSGIPIHEQLVTALNEKAERLVRALRAQGTLDLCWRAEWADIAQPTAEVTQSITLTDCTIQYEPFPYPLHHVRGLITARNREWRLHDVQGRGSNDAAVVTCSGNSTPVGDGSHLELFFRAENVPLDDNLRQALSPPAQQAWTELRPQGRVDFAAHIVHDTGQPKPAVAVRLTPREGSVSVEPKAFPYRFEQLEGMATFQNGRVELHNVIAHHDRATYSVRHGLWEPAPAGGWQLVLQSLNADRLTAHRDLILALPPKLQKTLERLQPVGMFAMHASTLSFASDPQSGRVSAAWDVNLNCHQASLHGGIPLENITGEIRLVGRDDAQASYTAGELAIDSLVWKDVQLTNVRGPLWVDRSTCLFGQAATNKQAQAPRQITADAYGGSLVGDGQIAHDGNPRYQVELGLGGVDLNRFANERLGGPSDLRGTVAGTLTLAGAGRSTHALSGTGELHIVDAHIYELPLLVALLKVVQIRTPTSTAFNRCDAQFSIQGEHVHFQQLNLIGDAVSLYGRGETNLERELNLVFYSLVGPVDLPIPLWKTIAGQLSEQSLQLKVNGTWDKPDIKRDVLPSFNHAWQQLQTELQSGAASVTPPGPLGLQGAPARR